MASPIHLALALCLAAPALSALGPAQDADADTNFVLGRVVDAQGRGVAGATVHAFARERRLDPGAALVLERSAQSGANGRFRISLDSETVAAIWAELEVDGGTRFSQIEPEATGARPLTLRLERLARKRLSLRLENTRPWKGQGPLRVLAIPDHPYWKPRELPVDEEGRATLFPEAGPAQMLLVEDASRHILWSHKIHSAQFAMASKPTEIRLPDPVEVEVRVYAVTEDEKRVPIPGATLSTKPPFDWRSGSPRMDARSRRSFWRHVGETDATGVATLRLPWMTRPGKVHSRVLLASAPGYAASMARLEAVPRAEKHPRAKLSIRVWRSPVLRGRVLGRDGQPMPGLRLGVHGTAHLEATKGGVRHMNYDERLFATDARGRFEIPGLIAGTRVRITAYPTREQSALGHTIALWSGTHSKGMQPQDLGDLRLEAGRDVEIVARASDGRPMRGAVLCWRSSSGGKPSDTQVHSVFLDRRGRTRIHVQGSELELLAYESKTGWAHTAVALAELQNGAVELEGRPWSTVNGKVLGPEGAPRANVRVSPWTYYHGVNVPELVKRHREHEGLNGVKTDENGEFVYRFIPWHRAWMELSAEVQLGGKPHRAEAPLRVDEKSLQGVEIRVVRK